LPAGFGAAGGSDGVVANGGMAAGAAGLLFAGFGAGGGSDGVVVSCGMTGGTAG